jgi:hypothetical protein
MMATTHMLAGMSLAVPLFVVAPELAPAALVAGLVGGVVPDLDLYLRHRKALHFPVYYTVLAVPAIGLAIAVPASWTISIAIGCAAAALHSTMDILGGGLELKPWRETSERAVYSHYLDRWLPPRRWVRYDGAPEDFALAGIIGLPLLATTDGIGQLGILVLLAVSAVYALLRKPVASLTEQLVSVLPKRVSPYVPERYRRTYDGQ